VAIVTANLNTRNSAQLFLELHGDEAVPEARKMVASMRERGDTEGADIWLRIIIAIEEMQPQANRMVS